MRNVARPKTAHHSLVRYSPRPFRLVTFILSLALASKTTSANHFRPSQGFFLSVIFNPFFLSTQHALLHFAGLCRLHQDTCSFLTHFWRSPTFSVTLHHPPILLSPPFVVFSFAKVRYFFRSLQACHAQSLSSLSCSSTFALSLSFSLIHCLFLRSDFVIAINIRFYSLAFVFFLFVISH